MYRYNDPQQVHGCECVRCLNWQADNELDVNDAGICWECVDVIAEDEETEQTDAFDARHNPSWFDMACEIVGR